MRRLITILSALAFLGVFFVVTPVPAAVPPGANPLPASIVLPVEEEPMLIVVGVNNFSVTLWGYSPTPHDTYFIAFAPTDGSDPGRFVVKEFEKPITRGYARIGRLLPDTEYLFVVKALNGLRWETIGKVKVTTLDPDVKSTKIMGVEKKSL